MCIFVWYYPLSSTQTNIDTLIQQLKEGIIIYHLLDLHYSMIFVLAIESVMPSQLDKYNAELKQYESEKVQSGHPPDDNVSLTLL